MQRHCTLPLRDPDAAQYTEARDERRCPVLDVPSWYWQAVRLDELLRMDLVSASELDAPEVALVRDLRRARDQIDAEEREWRRKKREILGGR